MRIGLSRGIALMAAAVCLVGCASAVDETPSEIAQGARSEGDTPVATLRSASGIVLGEPLAVTVDFDGNLLVADGVAGRIIRYAAGGDEAMEFQAPTLGTGFYPSDVKLSGFFIYALDAVGRLLVRFDKTASFRDVLIDFESAFEGRFVSPVGLDVDASGRVAVTDIKNHQVILFDSYLQIELVFGSYGSHPGQFDTPQGVTFTGDGGVLVADSGNRRVQFFDMAGTFLKQVPDASSPAAARPLREPRRAVQDGKGRLYVADPAAGGVFVFGADDILARTIVPMGSTSFRPTDVAVARSGLIYVTDSASGSILVFE